ncbi:MAG: hypothetical protein OXT67_01915 [Zetaproteobacteria bacterium]|nr:hypothetical protein [Zetaproteobacteria bacterium]
MGGCPFIESAGFSSEIAQLQGIVRSELEAKISAHQQCIAPLENIQNSLSLMDSLFANELNPNIRQGIADDVYNNQLMEAQADLILNGSNAGSYGLILNRVYALEDRIGQNEIDARWESQNHVFARNNRYLSKAYGYLENAVSTMKSLRPECVALLGGWQFLTPVLLNSASSLSGLAGFAYSSLIGANLKLISTMISFFQDFKVKKAIAKLQRQQNGKILACTYYSVQMATCQFKRGLFLSRQKKSLRRGITHKFAGKSVNRYKEFLSLWSAAPMFFHLFQTIALAGSAIHFDDEKVATYFAARKIRPFNILDSNDIGPPPSLDNPSPEAQLELQMWLYRMKERGIKFTDSSVLGAVPFQNQVDQVLAYIDKSKNDIRALEFFFSQRRSYMDIKAQFETIPDLQLGVKNFLMYFKSVQKNEIVSLTGRGAVTQAIRILMLLDDFLTLRFPLEVVLEDEMEDVAQEFPSDSFEFYRQRVNHSGEKLFEEVAKDSFGQIGEQNVLYIADVVQARIDRVFRLVEEEFLAEERRFILENQSSDEGSAPRYSEYKRSFLLLTQVTNNLGAYTGSPLAFKSEDIENTYAALEDGFVKELKKMLKEAITGNHASAMLPELNGETSAHLCALFIPFLNRHDHGFSMHSTRKLFSLCRKNYKELPLFDMITPSKLEIDWKNPCFYNDYRRVLALENSIYHRLVQLGYHIGQKHIDRSSAFPGFGHRSFHVPEQPNRLYNMFQHGGLHNL